MGEVLPLEGQECSSGKPLALTHCLGVCGPFNLYSIQGCFLSLLSDEQVDLEGQRPLQLCYPLIPVIQGMMPLSL